MMKPIGSAMRGRSATATTCREVGGAHTRERAEDHGQKARIDRPMVSPHVGEDALKTAGFPVGPGFVVVPRGQE